MHLSEMFFLGIALGADSLTVSMSVGADGVAPRKGMAMTLIFAVVHVGLLICGYLLAGGTHHLTALVFAGYGEQAVFAGVVPVAEMHNEVRRFISLAGAAVLAGLAISLVRVGPSRPFMRTYGGLQGVGVLSLAMGMDALAAGIGLGMLGRDGMGLAAVVVGLVMWGMGLLGIAVGHTLGRYGTGIVRWIGAGFLLYLAVSSAWMAISAPAWL